MVALVSQVTVTHKQQPISKFTSNEVHGRFLRHVSRAFGDDDGELGLVSERLEGLGHLDGWGGGTAGVEERRRRLQEQHGLLHVYDRYALRTVVCHARGEEGYKQKNLGGVGRVLDVDHVVGAHADDLRASREKSLHRHSRELLLLGGGETKTEVRVPGLLGYPTVFCCLFLKKARLKPRGPGPC